MKKSLILLWFQLLCLVQQISSMSTPKLSIEESEEVLNQKLLESQQAKDALFMKAKKTVDGLITAAQTGAQTLTDAITTAQTTIKNQFDEVDTTRQNNVALEKLVEIINKLKEIGSTFTGHVAQQIEQIYRPIAYSSLIPDADIKKKMQTLFAPIEQLIARYKKSFPVTLERSVVSPSLAEVVREPVKDVTPAREVVPLTKAADTTKVTATLPAPETKKGIAGLVDIIAKEPAKPSEEQQKILERKNEMIFAIKSNYQSIEKQHQAFNEAAEELMNALTKLQYIEPETANLEKTFKMFTDPAYSPSPFDKKFEILLKGYTVLVEALNTLGNAIQSTDQGFVNFISILSAGKPTSKITEFEATVTDLAQAIKNLGITLETHAQTIKDAKKKSLKQQQLTTAPQKPEAPLQPPQQKLYGTTTGEYVTAEQRNTEQMYYDYDLNSWVKYDASTRQWAKYP